MAEIKVEPKRSGLGWLWAIIILAVIAVAAWYFMHANRAAQTVTPADSTRTSLIDRAPIDHALNNHPLAIMMEGASNG
jgi:hypothetical protein